MMISTKSGLICLNWYDWNTLVLVTEPSGWTDVGIDLPELIRLKQSNGVCNMVDERIVGIDLPELIRLKHFKSTFTFLRKTVGIDLPELIRLKLFITCHVHFDWFFVGIDLPELIRLKHSKIFYTIFISELTSGLICLNWYDWNWYVFHLVRWNDCCRDWSAWIDTIETIYIIKTINHHTVVGIDLPELIRLKPLGNLLLLLHHLKVGIDLPELIRLKPASIVLSFTNAKPMGRDWSAWIDTIETSSPKAWA